jgi:opacity protein-like surface antigen
MTKSRFPALLKLAATILSSAASVSAAAQKLPTATAPGASITVGGTYSAVEAQYPQGVQYGAGAYIDLNFRHYLGLEGEARYLRQNTISGSNQTTYLIGPRLELHRGRFSPYLKGMIGDGKLLLPVRQYGDSYGYSIIFAGGAGLDVSLSDNLKLRLVDFEYQDWPSVNLGPILSIAPYGISAGLSYRVFHTGGWRRHHYR